MAVLAQILEKEKTISTSLFSLRNMKMMANWKKIVQTPLFVDQFWTIQKITPKSALLSYYYIITVQFQTWKHQSNMSKYLKSNTCLNQKLYYRYHFVNKKLKYPLMSLQNNWLRVLDKNMGSMKIITSFAVSRRLVKPVFYSEMSTNCQIMHLFRRTLYQDLLFWKRTPLT